MRMTSRQIPLHPDGQGGADCPVLGHLCQGEQVGHQPGEQLLAIGLREEVIERIEREGEDEKKEVTEGEQSDELFVDRLHIKLLGGESKETDRTP